MAQDSLPKVIRTNAGRLTAISSVVLAAIVALGVLAGAPALRAVRGPLVLDAEDFVSRLDRGELRGELVEVRGDRAVDSGVHRVFGDTSDALEDQPVSLVSFGARVVAVRTATPTTDPHVVGVVEAFDADEVESLLTRVRRNGVDTSTLAAVGLDASVDHVLRGRIEALVAAAFTAFAGAVFVWNLLTFCSPGTSRAMRRLRRRFGAEDLDAASAQLAQPHLHLSRLHVTRRWIVGVQSDERFVARPLSELVWCYRKVAPSRLVGLLSLGHDEHVVTVWADGKRSTFALDDATAAETVVAAITKFAPWAASGFTKELQTMWSKRRGELLESVDARRARLEQFNMAGEAAAVVWRAPERAVPEQQTVPQQTVPQQSVPDWTAPTWAAPEPLVQVAERVETETPVLTPVAAAPLPHPAPAPVTTPAPTAMPLPPQPEAKPETEVLPEAERAPLPESLPTLAPEPVAVQPGPILIFEPLPLGDGDEAPRW